MSQDRPGPRIEILFMVMGYREIHPSQIVDGETTSNRLKPIRAFKHGDAEYIGALDTNLQEFYKPRFGNQIVPNPLSSHAEVSC